MIVSVRSTPPVDCNVRANLQSADEEGRGMMKATHKSRCSIMAIGPQGKNPEAIEHLHSACIAIVQTHSRHGQDMATHLTSESEHVSAQIFGLQWWP